MEILKNTWAVSKFKVNARWSCQSQCLTETVCIICGGKSHVSCSREQTCGLKAMQTRLEAFGVSELPLQMIHSSRVQPSTPPGSTSVKE